MSAKKVKRLVVVLIIVLLLIAPKAPDIFRRFFGSDTEKSFYQINDIIDSYGFDFAGADPMPACAKGGAYYSKRYIKNEENVYEFVFDLAVNKTIYSDIIPKLSEIIDRINEEVLSKASFGEDVIHLEIVFNFCWRKTTIKGVISDDNRVIAKYISTAIPHDANLYATLLNLSDFERITLSGGPGDGLVIPDDFDYNIFSNLPKLKECVIYCEENEAVLKLEEAMKDSNIWFEFIY